MSLTRRGRPPVVAEVEGDLHVKVKGETYAFRQGADGKIRRVGKQDGDPADAEYAKTVVLRHLSGA